MRDDPFTDLARGRDCDADRNYLTIALCTSRIFRIHLFESLGGKVHDEATAGFCFLLAGDSLCLHSIVPSSPRPALVILGSLRGQKTQRVRVSRAQGRSFRYPLSDGGTSSSGEF